MKTLNNTQKAKTLRDTRKRLGYNQRVMADALGLDPSYLSQLENGIRPVDEWYVVKAAELAKAIEVKNANNLPLAQACEEHMRAFITACSGDVARLGWTITELKKHFPLDMWKRSGRASSKRDDAAALAGEISDAYEGRGRKE
jgi:transcriptional regulator with XRE-family HTH domain